MSERREAPRGGLARRRIAGAPVSLERAHFARARDWFLLRATVLRTLDALHLAVAADAGAEIVTGDDVMAEAAERLGVALLRVRG